MVALLAGCMSSPAPQAPASIHAQADAGTGSVTVSVKSFDVTDAATMNATVTWSYPSTSLSLELQPAAAGGTSSSDASHTTLTGKLAPGHYTLSLKGSAVVPDHWTLDATFALQK